MRAYYINLAHRTDRRAQMDARFAALGMVGDRVEAVTPADVSPQQRQRYCNPRAYRWQTEGELACSLSHVRAMQVFLATDAAYAAIFEDDAVLSPSLPAFLDAVEVAAPAIDLLRLETDHSPLRLVERPEQSVAGIGIHRVYSTGGGAAGYVVSRRGAERIAAGEEVLFGATDQALFNPYASLAGDLTMRQIRPALVVQQDRLADAGDRDQSSDLETLRKHRFRGDSDKRWTRLHYNIFDFFDRDLRLAAIKSWHQYVGGAAKRDIAFKAD